MLSYVEVLEWENGLRVEGGILLSCDWFVKRAW